MLNDTKAPFYKKSMYKNVKKIISQNIKGYSRIEFAKVLGAWAVYDYFYKAFAWGNAVSCKKKINLKRGGEYIKIHFFESIAFF